MTLELHRFLMALVPKIAMENVSSNPKRIFERISAKIAKLRENEPKYDYPQWKLNVKDHIEKDNLRNALHSHGCGCELCEARKSWARANRLLKLQENFTSTEGFLNIAERYYGPDYAPDSTCDDMFLRQEYFAALCNYRSINIAYKEANLDIRGITLSKKTNRFMNES